MWRLEVSAAVRHIYMSLGFKRLTAISEHRRVSALFIMQTALCLPLLLSPYSTLQYGISMITFYE